MNPPITPGGMLLEGYLKPLGISQNAMARAIGVSPRAVNEIVLGKRAITPAKKEPPHKPAIAAIPLPVREIVCRSEPLMAPWHTGGVYPPRIPREQWPSPTPAELAMIAAHLEDGGKKGSGGRAMELIWECAEAIHKSITSAEKFTDAIKSRPLRRLEQLQFACGFDFTALPQKISYGAFLKHFNKRKILVAGKPLEGIALFNHWNCSPSVGGGL